MRHLSLLLAFWTTSALAQPVLFGSSDDLFERGSGPTERDEVSASAFAGFAYLPDEWRLATRLEADITRGRLSSGLSLSLHPDTDGLYGREADDWLDVARILRYARINPTATSRIYARLGPTEHISLGSGALVRGYRTTAAWDERRIGFEAAAESRRATAGFFVDDVLLGGVIGAEGEVRSGRHAGPIRDLRLALAAVHDLDPRSDTALTGIEIRLRGQLVGDGTFAVLPFVTHARYLGKGSTIGIGVDGGAENLGDALRAVGRIAIFVSTPSFVPGAIGPLYAIQNQSGHVAVASSFYDQEPGLIRAGTPIDSLRAGVDLVLDGRIVAFGRFEVSQHLRRHFGPDRASAYGIRLAGQLPQGAQIEFALEREGFRGLWALLSDLGEENQLLLRLSAPIGNRTTVLVDSRYGFRRLEQDEIDSAAADGDEWYLVERRFEPMIGLRTRF